MATIQHEKVTSAELHQQFDALTRDKLGLSGSEFIERYQACRLDLTSPAMSNLALVARLLIAAEKND